MKPPAHSSGRAQLEHCQHLLLVSKVCCGVGPSPGCCPPGVHHLQKATAAVAPTPPARSLTEDDCWGLGWPKQVRISVVAPGPWPVFHQHIRSHAPQALMSLGQRRMDLSALHRRMAFLLHSAAQITECPA